MYAINTSYPVPNRTYTKMSDNATEMSKRWSNLWKQ